MQSMHALKQNYKKVSNTVEKNGKYACLDVNILDNRFSRQNPCGNY